MYPGCRGAQKEIVEALREEKIESYLKYTDTGMRRIDYFYEKPSTCDREMIEMNGHVRRVREMR